MATKNDERILTLKEQIEYKKKELGKQPRFSPITTCLFDYNGNTINIHTLIDVKNINQLLVYFNMWAMSADDLGIDAEEVTWCGFSVLDWIEDLKSKKAVVEYATKKEQLSALEKKFKNRTLTFISLSSLELS